MTIPGWFVTFAFCVFQSPTKKKGLRSERALVLLAPRKVNFMLQTDNSNAKVPQFIVEPLFVAGTIEMYIAALAAFISGFSATIDYRASLAVLYGTSCP